MSTMSEKGKKKTPENNSVRTEGTAMLEENSKRQKDAKSCRGHFYKKMQGSRYGTEGRPSLLTSEGPQQNRSV